jgi:hypothetical protein
MFKQCLKTVRTDGLVNLICKIGVLVVSLFVMFFSDMCSRAFICLLLLVNGFPSWTVLFSLYMVFLS